MYRILADECIHKDLVEALRSSGHHVTTICEVNLSGATDSEVFIYACENKLTLLTFDRGFGDIFNFEISKSNGVVIELINQMEKSEIIEIALAFFSQERDINGKLVIMGKTKIRISERWFDHRELCIAILSLPKDLYWGNQKVYGELVEPLEPYSSVKRSMFLFPA